MKQYRKIQLRFVFTLFLLMVFQSPALGAWIDPVLEEKLAQADTNEPVRAIVMLKDRVDLQKLDRQLKTEKAGYERRHFQVVAACMDHSALSQRDVLEMLKEQRRQGKTVSYRSFWITNGISLSAEPRVFNLLENHPGVESIYYDYELELIRPVEQADDQSDGSKGIEPGIEITGAPDLWDLGIDGTGVIVGDMDTGADGTHPAFADRWRGLEAESSECWFDPAQSETFPHDYASHGTHTLGTMIGDDGQGNQIGMAPGAKWIAAAVIDVPGANLLSDGIAAFEWFADPDGDPGTVDDVPAVINNSWGMGVPFFMPGCKEDFWDAIDVAEAAGVAVVFAAGNEGPRPKSLRSPPDRITTLFNTFAVGALNQNGVTIALFSSRGPSKCDGLTAKPEVSAVGKNVRSSTPNDTYRTMSGTSMAAPHVSGAIALLRQAYPDATVENLKAALYYTAVDLGAAGEDNTFGMGRIDVFAAYNFLSDGCDKDQDGYESIECGGDDCNDMIESIYPGATETCDGYDSDCDGNLPADETDEDQDGQMECEGDCDTSDSNSYLGAEEICDGKDNDCDGTVPADELDEDEDGYAACADDCDPGDPNVNPGAEEKCNGKDDNCDGLLDYTELDRDNDGYWICQGDCDDMDAKVFPGSAEVCWDSIDNDCDGAIDEEDSDCINEDDDDVIDDDDLSDDDSIDDDNDDEINTENSSEGDDDSETGCGC